jgi:hypothetical protein
VAEATLGDRRSHLLPVVLAEVVQTRRADVPGMTASIVIRRPASSMAAERMNPMPRPMPSAPPGHDDGPTRDWCEHDDSVLSEDAV